VFLPVFAERWSYYADNATWMRITQTAIDADTDAKTVLSALAGQSAGRAYAGLRSNWGDSLDFGIPFRSVRLYNMLTFDRVDAVAPPYRGASLNSDLLFDFNDQDPAQYRLFGVGYVIAPPAVTLAPGLVPIVSTPKYVLYRAPGGGYAEYAAISRSETPKSQPAVPRRAGSSRGTPIATRVRWTCPFRSPTARTRVSRTSAHSPADTTFSRAARPSRRWS